LEVPVYNILGNIQGVESLPIESWVVLKMFAKIEKTLVDRGHIGRALIVWLFAVQFEVLSRSRKKRVDWMIDLMDHVSRGMSLRQSEIQHTRPCPL
jgi:hypothetical protein